MADGENFMARNRKINGAYDPAPTPNSKARQIAANGPVPGDPSDPLFTPSMSTCEAINEAHYQGGISGAGPYSKSYEDKMPYTGERPFPEQKLKGR
jgi:hypothetical protein